MTKNTLSDNGKAMVGYCQQALTIAESLGLGIHPQNEQEMPEHLKVFNQLMALSLTIEAILSDKRCYLKARNIAEKNQKGGNVKCQNSL